MSFIVLGISAGRLGGPPKPGRVQLDGFELKVMFFFLISGLLAVVSVWELSCFSFGSCKGLEVR